MNNNSITLRTSNILLSSNNVSKFNNLKISYSEFLWLYRGKRISINKEWSFYQSNKEQWLHSVDKTIARNVLSFLNSKQLV